MMFWELVAIVAGLVLAPPAGWLLGAWMADHTYCRDQSMETEHDHALPRDVERRHLA